MKRFEIAFRLLGAAFAEFFFRSFSASFRISKKDSKNVELSHILAFESLFCFVFRTSVLQKRRTVAHFGREIVVLQCFPDISVAKT